MRAYRQTARWRKAEDLASCLVASDTLVPGSPRVMCSHRSQVTCQESESGRQQSEVEPTPDVVLGPDCPVHHYPMHRIPALPKLVTQWNCHGYDGEGCTIKLTTKTEVIPLIEVA